MNMHKEREREREREVERERGEIISHDVIVMCLSSLCAGSVACVVDDLYLSLCLRHVLGSKAKDSVCRAAGFGEWGVHGSGS